MGGRIWSDDEKADIIRVAAGEMTQLEFITNHPGRTFASVAGRASTLKSQLTKGGSSELTKLAELRERSAPRQAAMPDRVVEIPIQVDEPYGIVFLSDLHIGNDGVDYEKMLADAFLINSCNRLGVFLGGDPVDNYVTAKLGHAARESASTPHEQYQAYADYLAELSPSIIAVGSGNHDDWSFLTAGLPMNQILVKDLSVPFVGEQGYIKLTVGDIQYTIYRKHKPGRFGSSAKNPTMCVQNAYDLGLMPFDLGVFEHHHEPCFSTFWRHDKQRYALRAGSYKIRDLHAENGGYYHARAEFPVAVFNPKQREIQLFATIKQGIAHLEAI